MRALGRQLLARPVATRLGRRGHFHFCPRSAKKSLSVVSRLACSPICTRIAKYGNLTRSPQYEETIYALSTPQGKAGIAVIRVSGPACLDIYRQLCPGKKVPTPRYATVRTLKNPLGPAGDVLDSQAVVLFFPRTKTVTGEDVLELHVHGGPATVKAILGAIPKAKSALGLIRYAEPGEFTRRAFLNGRLDLAQVEALSDALDAETEQQRKAAVRGQSGKLGVKYNNWRDLLLYARAEIEALIDFSEDQHFDESPEELLSNTLGLLNEIIDAIKIHEDASLCAELLRSGIRIALVGPPNVGKSSLMNLVIGREASIVSHEAGTTRDIIEASLDIRGYLCSFADTAGFRSQAADKDNIIGAVETEGIKRAKQKALESDVVVVLASIERNETGNFTVYHDPETLEIAANAPQSLTILNKIDKVGAAQLESLLADFKQRLPPGEGYFKDPPILGISCSDAQRDAGLRADPGGITTVIDALVGKFAQMTELPTDLQDLLGVTARQAQLLAECRGHLEAVVEEASSANEERGLDIVLVAENLRLAAVFLARLTGKGESGDVEEVLGVIFEKFCVGK